MILNSILFQIILILCHFFSISFINNISNENQKSFKLSKSTFKSRNRNNVKSDKYDSIGNTIVLNGKTERTTASFSRLHFSQNARITRRSCSARSSRTTFGWSVVSFISVCFFEGLRGWILEDDDGFSRWKLYLLYRC